MLEKIFFRLQNDCFKAKKPYICIVFFMVLDY